MAQLEADRAPSDATADSGWRSICRIGGVSALILIAYSLATMVQLVLLGGQPTTAAEAFDLLQRNRLVGLLRLDVPTLFVMPLYYLLFSGIYAGLRRTDRALAGLATALAFVGVTLFLATPSALSLASLSDKYTAASSQALRDQLTAAAEAILAADMWHGTGAIIGGILLQTAAVWVSVLMLRGNVFGKPTAYVGILTHGLDLAHIIAGLLAPKAGFVLMAIGGPLYLVWFPLVGRRLLQLGRAPGTVPQ
jgi:hypothetical protein